MARGVIVGYKTNSRIIPAVVYAQYDTNGDVVADASGFTGVTTVDVILLGVDSGYRKGVGLQADGGTSEQNEAAASVNECFILS